MSRKARQRRGSSSSDKRRIGVAKKTLDDLRRERPEIEARGFWKAARDHAVRQYGRIGFLRRLAEHREGELDFFGWLPDGFTFDDLQQSVTLYEAEDTSPLTRGKLRAMVDFEDLACALGWSVELVIVDRYGNILEPVEPEAILLRILCAEVGDRCVDAEAA